MRNKLYKLSALIAGLTLLISCRLQRELYSVENKDKLLLNKYSVKLEKNNAKENLNVSEYSLGEYVKQKPNRKFILSRWMPYTSIYLRAQDHFKKPNHEIKIKNKLNKLEKKFEKKIDKAVNNSEKIQNLNTKKTKKTQTLNDKMTVGNAVMQSLNQAPVWVNDSLTNLSIKQLRLFLESNGFFHPEIKCSKKSRRNKRAENIIYEVKENKPHTIKNINYDISDTTILQLLTLHAKESFLKIKDNYSVNNISQERERIHNLLKNNGYFDFQRQFITFRIDTTIKDFEVYIDLEIKNPLLKRHTQYTLNNISVFIDVEEGTSFDTVHFNGINYFQNPEKKYSKKILDEEIILSKGDVFSQDKSRFTKNNLGSLDIVKFVNINFSKSDSSNLNAFITIKTFKKFQMNTEIGGNLNVVNTQVIPGPYINYKIKDRQIFQGFESLELNTLFGFQGLVNYANPDSLFLSRELGSTLTMSFPKLLIPSFIKNSSLLKRQNPFKNNIYKQTRLNIGYKNILRQEFTRTNFNLNIKYEWRKGQNEQFNFSPLELNFVNTPTKTKTFETYLDNLAKNNGINFKQSFISTIISNAAFGYTWNNIDVTKNKKATMIKFNAEIGGLLANAIDHLGNNNDSLLNLPFTKYFKLSTDLRKYFPLTKYSNLVARTALGYEQNILNSSFLPFEKYFYTGGVSSNRAWRFGTLGPGNYNPIDDEAKESVKPGEILFEANLEYRTKIYGVFNTAFFIDAGNVWSNSDTDSRPNTQLDIKNLYNAIGVGAGTGLRFDFSLLIARFDFAWKIFDPAEQGFVKYKINNALFNFGIGYPF